MKKTIFSLILTLILFLINFASFSLAQSNKTQNIKVQNTETITISTYYPAPYGVYKTLRLYPAKDFDPAATCSSKGEIVYSGSDNQTYVCDGSNWSSSAKPLVIYAQDQIARVIEDVVIELKPDPTLDNTMVLRVPVKAQEVVKVSFNGMFQGPGYTGVWLTSGAATLVSGWIPSSRIGAWSKNWVPFQITGFWKATADGVLIFQQGYYKSDLAGKTNKDNVVAISNRFAFAEKVRLMLSE